MKQLLYFFIGKFILLNSCIVASEDQIEQVSKNYQEVKETSKNQEDILKKVLKVPGVQSVYDTCKQEPNSNDLNEVAKCLWSKVNDETKKQVKEVYAKATKADENSVGENASAHEKKEKDFTVKKLGIGVDYKNDPGYLAVSDYFQKKFDEVFKPKKDENDKAINTVDHQAFTSLYKNELGKSIVEALASYCYDAKYRHAPDGNGFIITVPDSSTKAGQEEIKANREQNNKELSNIDLTSTDNKFNTCLSTVPRICYWNKSEKIDPTRYDNDKASVNRSCQINEYIKSARKNLMLTSELEEKFFSKLNTGIQFRDAGFKQVDRDPKYDAEKMIQIASTDVKEIIEKKNKENLEKIEKCEQNVNEKECGEFLSKDKEKKENAVIAAGINAEIETKELEEKLKDEKFVREYLKKEGREDKEVNELTKAENLEKTKEEINDRYKKEKDAIISSMQNQVYKTTSTTNDKIENTDIDKIEVIKKELTSKPDDLKSMIHFNNVVSSFLVKSEDKGKNAERYLASINVEAEKDRALKDKVKSAGLKNSKEKSTGSLGLDTINKLLSYVGYKKEEKDQK